MSSYETEVRNRWGETAAYREYNEKTKHYAPAKWTEVNDRMMAIFSDFAACKEHGFAADSPDAQQIVLKLKSHITKNYYTCTDEILAVLGKTYAADERFQINIDKYGVGTAAFAAAAIEIFCKGQARQ